MTDLALSPDVLAGEAASVRRIALALVRDPSHADDALQDAWLEAVQRPAGIANPRAWLRTVVRNAEKRAATSAVARRQREERAARPEALEADGALVAERVRRQREIAGHVLALDEPYRTTVLLRFFEDLPPREIAKRLGRPVNTVRTHLERGLAKLREELDEQYGDRSAWAVAFLPIALPLEPGSVAMASSGAGSSLVARLGLVSVAVAVVSTGLWFMAGGSGGQERVSLLDLPNAAVVVEPVGDVPVVAASGEPGREAVQALRSVPPELAAADVGVDSAPIVASGRVVGIDGRPVPGVELELLDPTWPHLSGGSLWSGTRGVRVNDVERIPDAEVERIVRQSGTAHPERYRALLLGEEVEHFPVTTGSDGAWEGETPSQPFHLEIRSERWVRVTGAETPEGSVTIVAPAVPLRGSVVDEAGTPLAGLDVRFGTSPASIPGFPLYLPGDDYRSWSARTDESGRFDFVRAPHVPGLSVDVNHREWMPESKSLPVDATEELHFVLRRRPARPRVAGTVRHRDGSVAAGAIVNLGQDGTYTDEFGRFDFELTVRHDEAPLTAALQGFQAAVDETFCARLLEDPSAGDDVTLTLGNEALVLEGRVEDAEGEPLEGWIVKLPWATPLGTYYKMNVESFSAQGFGEPADVVTKGDGTFRLSGLRDVPYRVRAYDPETMLVVDGDPVRPGSPLVLRVPEDAFARDVTVRVVTAAGQAVGGASVAVETLVSKSTYGTAGRSAQLGVTDKWGRLEVGAMPWRSVHLRVMGRGIEITSVDIDGRPSGELVAVVKLELEFRVDLATITEPCELQLLDATGERLVFTTFRPSATVLDESPWLDPRKLPLRFLTTDEARVVRLVRDGVELARQPLDLVGGELTTIVF